MPKSKLIPQQPQPEKLKVSQHGYVTTVVNNYPKKYELTDPIAMLEKSIEMIAMDKGLMATRALLGVVLKNISDEWLESVIKDSQQEAQE